MLCAGIAAACSRPDATIRVGVDTTAGAGAATVVVGGLALSDSGRVRISVRGDSTRIAGRYVAHDTALVFRPSFPLDRDRDYEVVVDNGTVVRQFRLPALDLKPSTRVTAIYPAGDVLPENQLRLYVEFSAPMSRAGGLPYVRLLDGQGREVKEAFLPLDADFWNPDRTRYTLFLDPGRVKRGILPNDQMGRALVAGRRYSIAVDSSWADGRGQPLVAPFTKEFRAGPADFRPIAIDDWRVRIPKARTREPVIVEFPEALDYGLLQRALSVETQAGQAVGGQTRVSANQREWRFTPDSWWPVDVYRVVVLEFLEDLAGNRVNRAFEVDLFTQADTTAAPSRFVLPFRVR